MTPPDFVEIARAHWGAALPDWIKALAEACTKSSQTKVAAQLGRSGALVSSVLRNKYAGDMGAVEELVRGHLLSETVACPSLGVLPLHECRAWRAKATRFENTNALRVQMYRACQRCPRFRKDEE
ncbi:hypothetical protein [Pararhodobacter sp.]|uniref:hypothetical protein n=1 Tax=Pararhodobacter sp. TaxID=2127056 RepID=UPI002AFEF587|nr:hypothetical protein [Pararhodobacter sp.]